VRYRADLGVTLPQELRKDFLSKLWYVSDAIEALSLDDERLDLVTFDLRTPDDALAGSVATRITDVARRMLAGYRPLERRVVLDRTASAPSSGEDPHAALAASGDLHLFGRGRAGIGPLLARLLDLLGADLRRLGDDLHTAPHRFPTLIGADTLARCRYFEAFPHALTIASHLREDLDAIAAFARDAKVEQGRLVTDPHALAPSECLLSPAVCFHLYAWLAGSKLEGTTLARAEGKCFRYESGALEGLARLWDFTMSEFVAVGTQPEALAFRERGMARAQTLFDDWGLAYEIHTATDPFFVDAFAKQAVFQAAFELKFEASAVLPYRGDGLAISSFNYHQDFFGRSFEISDAAGKPAHTACVAFGVERFALAFIAQHGRDPRRWPARIRQLYAEAGA